MTDTTKSSNLEDKLFACFCRDRDTRVLRAIIAAASNAQLSAPNPTSTTPNLNHPNPIHPNPNHPPSISITTLPTNHNPNHRTSNHLPPTPPHHDTDLHRPILGNGGNTMGRVVDVLVREGVLPGELLMAAWMTLPGVPMAAQTLDDVRAFVADVDATARQVSVARRLAREVHAAVMAQEEVEQRIREDTRRMHEREAELEAKKDGSYWRQRDGRRVAKQSTHVLVDPDAWQAMKEEARRQQTSVGEIVGAWVTAMVSDPSQLAEAQGEGLPNRDGKARLVDMVSRIDVDREEWGWAKADAAALGVRVARYVGLVVERRTEDVRRTARPRRRARRVSRRRPSAS